MASVVSTITSKWQVTIPEAVRKEIPFKVGQRIVWEVDGEKLVGRRVRTISELAGCLKNDEALVTKADVAGAFARAAAMRHERIAKQKP
jgi:bifunctional DNA-binding transcriptional regulator/antitoxin component of YhaV-PrlF toxin-antitoxin module